MQRVVLVVFSRRLALTVLFEYCYTGHALDQMEPFVNGAKYRNL